ncbi:MAG: antibiotic biosynthesis monooxygenase [Actinomycetota bacterium]
MSAPITLIVESAVAEGKLNELRSLTAEVAAHCAETEDGLLTYDWFISDDSTRIRVFEQYADSDAIRFHAGNYATFLPALAECRTVERMTILGEPDDELRQMLEARGAGIFGPFASLPR